MFCLAAVGSPCETNFDLGLPFKMYDNFPLDFFWGGGGGCWSMRVVIQGWILFPKLPPTGFVGSAVADSPPLEREPEP